MSTQSEEYELDTVTFPRKEKRGIILGLDPAPLIAVSIDIVLILLISIVVPFPFGILLALCLIPVGAFLGWARYKGKHLFEWMGIGKRHLQRKLSGQNTYAAAGPDEDANAERRALEKARKEDERAEKEALEWEEEVPAKTPPPVHMRLPGAANELKAYRTVNGDGLVHDPMHHRVVITARLKSHNFTLQDDTDQAEILDRWANVQDVIGAHRVVEHIVPTDVTTVATGQQMQQFYEDAARRGNAGAKLNPVAHEGYMDLLSQNVMTHHPQYLTFALRIPEMRDEIKSNGGGMAGLLRTTDYHMGTLEADLYSNGYEIDHWVGVDERLELLHEAFSPEAIGLLEGVSGRGGPRGAKRFWDHLRVDNVWHRAFVIEEWPLKPVRPGFMEKLVLDLEFRHSVSLLHKRGNDESALRKINNEIKDADNAENMARRMGRRVSREQEREREDLESREDQMVGGASETAFRGFVTITADSKDQLEQYTRDLRSAAARASLRIEPAYGQQFEAFLAGACLLGLGADKR
ncbi:hypothetical protein NBM05_07350 [Rothia sp. AR01]|uniref:Uncharacterized protein n=1 Tax=Rothia santali TaxID=2949643 RepID=A0A9X2HAM9_9MICC|nr:SCO6880 family protein [Rothia santali]MCP3425826.1 hypothetical protein [Rothia santali]